MADMIKFYRGLVGNLPAAGDNGALYITTDEGAIYYGTGTGMKRLGDFIQVASVNNLPTDGANTSALYYCVAENILAKWNGETWTQINKQPTADELKTLLGLGSLAYKSEIAEGDLNAALKEKVNAAAEGNHSHANKALLDTYTQTEADLADAVAKKHSHANADELAKIADGDKAKWDAVAADHLTSADKTALENSIKEAKQAGTDANTNVEAYKVTNDARVKAVEDDIAEITDGTNGILAQAKAYADGKDGAIAEAKAAGTTAQSNLEAYQTSNNAALAGVKATADAAAVKADVDTALAGKVDKVEGKSLISDSEIARLANVTNYDDTQVKADIAKKADAETMTTELGKKVDKVAGYSLVSDTEIARLADVDNYDDAEVRGLIGDNADAIAAINNADTGILKQAKDYADGKDEAIAAAKKAGDDAQDAVDALAAKVGDVTEGKTVVEMIADAQDAATYDDTALSNRVKAIEDDYLVEADKTELANAIAAEKERAELAEQGLQGQINLIMNNPDTEGVINSIEEFTNYINTHGEIAEGFRTDIDKNKEDIAANAKAISDHETSAAATYETKEDAADKLEAAKEYADGAADAVLGTADDESSANTVFGAKKYADEKAAAAQSAAEKTASDALSVAKTELQAEIDADVKVVNDALEAYKTSNNAEVAKKANAADVYAKTETYTKDEVDAIVAAAHTWGEF